MNASELLMTCRKANQLTSKPESVVAPGRVQTEPVYGLSGVRCRGSMSLIQALMWNVGTCWLNVKERAVAKIGSCASTDVSQRDGAARSSVKATVMVVERRSCVIQLILTANRNGRSS